MPGRTDDGSRPFARRLSRRRLLSSTGAAGAGLFAAALIGCDRTPAVPVPTPRETRPTNAESTPTAQPTPSIRRGGVWRMALAADPGSLDPHVNNSANGKAAAAPVYSRLLGYESGPGKARVSFSTVPDAAEFTQAPDAQTFVVRLNPRAKFTAPVARAMTSADVKYSFDRLFGRSTSFSTPSTDAQLLSMVDSIETPDERTVTFRLKQPYGAFPQVLADARALMLMPAEAAQAFDPSRQMVGSGPFVLKSYEAGALLTYTRNPEWHLGTDRPFLDGIQVSVLRDAPAAVSQFLAGDLDALTITAADVKPLRDGVKGVVIDQTAPLQVQNITFSGIDFEPPWRDVRVRRAVSMAINRDAMLDESFGLKDVKAAGLEVAYTWDGFLPWGITGYSLEPKQMKPERLNSFKYNTGEAAKLMDAAGWRDGFGVEWHYTSGFRGGYPLNARLVAQQLREIKIQLRTTVEDYGTVFLGSTMPGNFRGMASTAHSLGEPGNYLSALYLPGAARNTAKLNDPRLTERIQTIVANTNREERRQQILDVQDYLAEQMYNVPLPNGPVLTAYQPSARNVLDYQSPGVASAVDQVPYYWKA